jgi:hypothetical protein
LRLKKIVAGLGILLSFLAWGQQFSHRISNQDIIDMTALGLSDEVIITKIHSAARPEDLAFDKAQAEVTRSSSNWWVKPGETGAGSRVHSSEQGRPHSGYRLRTRQHGAIFS